MKQKVFILEVFKKSDSLDIVVRDPQSGSAIDLVHDFESVVSCLDNALS